MMSLIAESKIQKDYAVVFFIESQSYSEIPTNWLLYDDRYKGKIACRWPGRGVKNIVQKVKNRITPHEDWPVYAVKILKYSDTLESARKAAEDSQYSSAPETLGRGHRRKKVTSPVRRALSGKRNIIYSSSSGEESDRREPIPPLPNFPMDSAPKGNSNSSERRREVSDSENSRKSHEYNTDLDNDNDFDNTLSAACGGPSSMKSSNGKLKAITSRTRSVYESTDVQVNRELEDRKLKVLEDKVDTCIHLLSKVITELRDLKERSLSNNNGNSSLGTAISAEVEIHLKLDTRDGVTAFEARLKSCKEFEDEFIRKIKQVGGSNGKDYTERALAFTFSNKFAKSNTWEGKITKYKVSSLKVIEICEKVILEKFPTWDKAEFGKAGTNWFRLGNQRAGDQPKQVMRKTIQTLTENQENDGQDA